MSRHSPAVKPQRVTLPLTLVLALVLALCSPASTATAADDEVRRISPRELAAMLGDQNLLVVDVRTTNSWNKNE